MKRSTLVFWGSALGVAVAFAALAAAFLPYERLRLLSAPERERAWLLTVWTAGVIAVLFGLSARLGVFSGIGFREVVEARSVGEALRMHREKQKEPQGDFARTFDSWLIVTGGMLVGIYFAGWLLLR